VKTALRTPDDEPAPDAVVPPEPPQGARWRWSTSRRVMLGSGALAVVLGLGGAAAGASTTGESQNAPPHGQRGQPPGNGSKPAAVGKITALSGDVITLDGRQNTTQSVTYSTTTTFRSQTGTASAASLKVGDFVAVQGTTNSDGSVRATTIMISTNPPGSRPNGTGGPRVGAAPTNQTAPTG
jgi:hypothetical protein